MGQLRSSRNLIKTWRRREKVIIDHLVKTTRPTKKDTPITRHSAFTDAGLAVEDQVRKAWQPYSFGLAMF